MSAVWLGLVVGGAALALGTVIVAPEIAAFLRYMAACAARWFD